MNYFVHGEMNLKTESHTLWKLKAFIKKCALTFLDPFFDELKFIQSMLIIRFSVKFAVLRVLSGYKSTTKLNR